MNWIKIEDKLPEVHQPVIYYFNMVGVHARTYSGLTEFGPQFGGVAGFLTSDVTHWMPLLEPPEDS